MNGRGRDGVNSAAQLSRAEIFPSTLGVLQRGKIRGEIQPQRKGAYMLLHPGPPLSQSTRGAEDALLRAEKNLNIISVNPQYIQPSTAKTHQYHMCMVDAEFRSASR